MNREAQALALARDGAVCVRGVLDRRWLDELAGLFADLQPQGTDLSSYYGEAGSGKPGAGRGQTVIHDDCWRVSPMFLRFLHESPLAAIAAALMKSTQARLFEDLLIYKSPGAEQPTPWHQDEPQWPLSGQHMVSAWFCLDPVTLDTGALRFAVGTHRGPMYRPAMPPERAADLEADAHHFAADPVPDADARPSVFTVKGFDVRPGDAIFFHPRVLHAALGSAPTRSRRTFSVRFIGDDVRWLPKRSVFHDWLKAIPLREGDVIQHDRFPQLWPRPTA